MSQLLGRVLGAAAAVALAGGCDASPPPPRLVSIEPDATYSDQPTPVILRGTGFYPGVEIDTETGRRSMSAAPFVGRVGAVGALPVALGEIVWVSPEQMHAVVEPGLPDGVYDVELEDPFGRRSVLKLGYRSLGPDVDVPRVQFTTPAADIVVPPGTPLELAIMASDQPPGRLQRLVLRAASPTLGVIEETHELPQRPGSITVGFRRAFEAPYTADGETIVVTAQALDLAAVPNLGEARLAIHVRLPPELAGIEPRVGPTAGGVDVILRGTRFVRGSKVYLGGVPLLPDGGIVVDESAIAGRLPPHPAGPVDVEVISPAGRAHVANGFEYRDAPLLFYVTPDRGPEGGGTPVTIVGQDIAPDAAVYMGRSVASALPVVLRSIDRERAEGLTPPGKGRVDMWLVDPLLGVTRLGEAFEYLEQVCLLGIDPPEGRESGGTPVTVRGCGFTDETTILVGPSLLPLDEPVRVDAERMTGRMPPGTDVVDVFAFTQGLGYRVLPRAFTYRPPPVLTAVIPPFGPRTGGPLITLKGSHLTAGSTVLFGSTASPQVRALDSSTLSVSLPPGPAGPVAVTVSSGFGVTAPLVFDYRDATDGVLRISPARLVRGDTITVVIDGDSDPATNRTSGPSNDTASVTIGSALEVETLQLRETPVEGSFVLAVTTAAGPAVAGDGILQLAVAGTVTASYRDALRVSGGSALVESMAAVLPGDDGRISLEPDVVVPGLTFELLVNDRDPRADGQPDGGNDSVVVSLATSGGDSERLVVGESSVSGRFHAYVATTAGAPRPSSGVLEVAPGEEIVARYRDALRADGATNVDVTATVKVKP